LHGAGDGGDGIEIPVRGEQAGEKFIVGGNLSGIRHFEAVNPRLLCEEFVVILLQLQRWMRGIGSDNEWDCHCDHPSVVMSPSWGHALISLTGRAAKRSIFIRQIYPQSSSFKYEKR
jgi:hypothetical protein